MKARQLKAWTDWLKHHPAKRLGTTVAITAAAFCAAAAPHVAAAGDNDASSALTTASTTIRDVAITTKAKAALVGKDNLSSGDIHVNTRHGDVVLTGSVPDLQQRTLAVNTVKQVEGVQEVHDQLTIRPK
ncbi:BON domain-containing protein [Burkholderia sp. BCC1977]|uniref:BON domain-containing protein n=1 Tax=Burkholderia sp. BCC1977 TaxID=2817440 RepID=UPI002ABDCF75|nr:BON domain-containing protein [Burkholderia sp. BCC1977]